MSELTTGDANGAGGGAAGVGEAGVGTMEVVRIGGIAAGEGLTREERDALFALAVFV